MNMPEQSQAGRRDLATALRDLAWTIQRLVPEAAGVPSLPASEVAVLKQVLAAPGVTVGELARHLGMQQSNTSAAVRALVERGLLARESSPLDRRVTRLVPTDKLLAEHDAIERAWSGTIAAAMTRLEPDQVAALEAVSGPLRDLERVLRER